ncbi:MAG: hypothetical protein J6S72_04570, partial [Lachnospiraceae bacterium]|nr:hypothetical protein [Lachnospiraceae bacterium]
MIRRWEFARIISLILAVCMFSGAVIPYTQVFAASGARLKDKYVGFEGIPVEWKYGADSDVFSYKDTMKQLSASYYDGEAITVGAASITDENGAGSVVSFEGRDAFLSSGKSEYCEFDLNVPEDAIYRLELDYYLDTNVSDSAKRALYIDGKYPFTEAGDLVFYRFFRDEGEPILNSIGDETRPKQVAINGWRTAGLSDTSGITSGEFNLYLTKGSHKVRFVTMKTGMYISEVRACAPIQIRPYAEVLAGYKAAGYTAAAADTINFQAELTAVEKNDPTLRRENDGDPLVVPMSDTSRKLNVMGGYRWRTGNQSITWEFEVAADGLYKIGLYTKQQWNDGMPSYRKIAIDGAVPFAELEEYKFEYDTTWRLRTLSDANGEPFSFYLTKGVHRLTMTVKLGDLGTILTSIEEDIAILSDMLLDIDLIAGNSPDPNYDYKFFDKIPDMKERLEYLLDSMEYKYVYAKGLSEKTPSIANNFLTIKAQIQMMLDDPFSIAKKVGDLQNSQTNLSKWYQTLQIVPLVIDSFY